jgi:protein ImuB
MRYLSLWLENWGIEAGLGRRAPDHSRPHPLAAYARIGNVHCLVAVNEAARRLGLARGLTLAEARARHPRLETLEHDPAAAAARLAALAAWCRRFTPLSACDAPDGLMLDISGAAHLFGGEKSLIEEIESRLAAQGLTARAAIAGTPEAAWALARFSPQKIAAAAADSKILARLVEPLPLAALRLDRQIVAALAQSGLRRIGDIAQRPRGPLTARFGPVLFARLDAVMGRIKSPISPLVEAPAYIAERRFAEGIVSRQDVEATILALARDLAGLLEQHAEGARRLAIHLFRVDGMVKEIAVSTSRPLADPPAIARLFHERIEAVSAGDSDDPLDAGYGFDVLQLAAYAVEPLPRVQQKWTAIFGEGGGSPDTGREALLADLVDRLGARLGVKRVQRLIPNDTHSPEFAVIAVPAAEFRTFSPRGRGSVRRTGVREVNAGPFFPNGRELALPARPIRLFEHPEPIDAIALVPDGPPLRFRWRRVMHEVAAFEGPERIAPEWWKEQKGALTRDYFRVEDREGQRFWLFRAGLYQDAAENAESGSAAEQGTKLPFHPRWYVHGLFA